MSPRPGAGPLRRGAVQQMKSAKYLIMEKGGVGGGWVGGSGCGIKEKTAG